MRKVITGIVIMRYPNEQEVQTYSLQGIDDSEPFTIEGHRCVVNQYGDATFVEIFRDGELVFNMRAELVKYIRRADASSAT